MQIEFPPGPIPGSLDKSDSDPLQKSLSGLHFVCKMTASFTRSESDGLQNFQGLSNLKTWTCAKLHKSLKCFINFYAGNGTNCRRKRCIPQAKNSVSTCSSKNIHKMPILKLNILQLCLFIYFCFSLIKFVFIAK